MLKLAMWVKSSIRAMLLLIVAVCTTAQPAAPGYQPLLQKFASYPADPCSGAPVEDDDPNAIEVALFNATVADIARELGDSRATPAEAALSAERALKRVEEASRVINADWPAESRFHFKTLPLPPALVLQLEMRGHERFFVLGVPEQIDGKPNRHWRNVAQDDHLSEKAPSISVELKPLHAGAPGTIRFLAKSTLSGCGGSLGIEYAVMEWDPKNAAGARQVLLQEGSLGLDDNVKDFPRIGKLETGGSRLVLPYCVFSSIDTWDNPSLCAADVYDVSGAEVKFKSRQWNRPDLVPVAKAVEYAGKRDYAATLAYCASSVVARTLIHTIPDRVFAGELTVNPAAPGKEHVVLGDDPQYLFDVEKRGDKWVVTGYRVK